MSEFLSEAEANNKELITELGSQILNRPVVSVAPLGGLISYNYELNHKWILKLPAQGTRLSSWIEQSKYMPALQKQLKYQIPVPTVKACHIPNQTDRKIVGSCYKKIEGDILPRHCFHEKSKSQKIHFFEQLSDAMSQLHQVKPSSLPISFQPKIEYIAQFLFPKSQLKRQLFQKSIQTIFKLNGVDIRNHILSHSDLHSENVCVSQNKIQGIIDFDSLSLGDYWMEFSPHLYRKKELELFREIYQQRSGHSVNPKAIKCINTIGSTLFFFNTLGALHIPTKNPKSHSYFKEISRTY